MATVHAEEQLLDLLGARVHWADFGGPERPAALCVMVHGLGGATVNWEPLAALLVDRFHCVALDLVGFGRTEPGERRGRVSDNTELLAAFVDRVRPAGLPLVLVGNSMGGLIAARYAGTHPPGLAGVVLVDPALPPRRPVPGPGALAAAGVYGVPGLGTAFSRARRQLRTPQQSVLDTLRLCTRDPGVIAPEVVERHVELAMVRVARPELDRFYADAARSVFGLLGRRSQADRVYADIDVPVLLVHGTHDRLVPFASALRTARRNPHWRFRPLGGRGHLPMLEDPGWLAAQLLAWWDDTGG
jgi:pimeloyl-ACP methyl ester carboxylesterase